MFTILATIFDNSSNAATRLWGSCSTLICVGCLIVAMPGCENTTPPKPESPAAVAQPSVSVQVARAESLTLRPTLELVGTLIAIPEKTAIVSSQLGGWVRKLNVVEGQPVHAGDLLVELDPRSAQVAVQRAEAVVAEKTAAENRLKRGYLPEEIAGARQDADMAAANVEGLRNELDALKVLLDRQELSSVVYESKAKALQSAEAAKASALERVKLLEAGTRPEMIAEAHALLTAARADLKQAKLSLEWCSIASPLSGRVVQLSARQGQFIDRAGPLATVIDLSQLFVQIRIPSSRFASVHVGTPVSVRLASLPDKGFSGQIARIGSQAELATGDVLVFATINNEEHLLRPGLNCQAIVSLPKIPNALAIPVATVGDHAGTPVVTVIREGQAYETPVELGVETEELVQVLSGLKAGDTVATSGGYGLPEGTSVKVSSSPAVAQ